MTRAQWKDLLEGFGFVAIIASLIFVGIETRNSSKQTELNTQAIEIAAYQELMNNVADLNFSVIESPEVAALMRKAWLNEEELTDLESFRFTRSAFARLRHGDIAYFQYERGAIDEERLRTALRPLFLSHPRMQAFWADSKHNFVQPYQDFIDSLIEEFNQAQ